MFPSGSNGLERALHDLCQPLTALQCRLYLGALSAEQGDGAACAEAMHDALGECDRLMEQVRNMQLTLQSGGAA